MKKFCSIFIICFGIHIAGNACDDHAKPLKVNYLKVKAKSGQGALALLREYQVHEFSCVLDEFYKLNKLKKNVDLKVGQEYLLPIKTLAFDGKSIRSTLDINDYELAKSIEKFNQTATAKKLRKHDFKKSKLLWVPPYDITCNDVAESNPIKSENKESKNTNTTSEKETKVSIADKKLLSPNDEIVHADNTKLVSETPELKRVSNKKVTFSLFGKKYEEVSIVSNKLNGQAFYLVPGHGGPDPGAVAKNIHGNFDACEDEYAYDVSLRLAKNLIENGAEVFVIVQDKNDGIRDEMYLDCDTDEVCMGDHEIPINQKKRLRQGMKKVNSLYHKNKGNKIKNHWMISIHVDSRPSEDRQDVFFYYQSDSPESKSKTIDIQNVFTQKYETFQNREYKGSASARPLYVIRASRPEPIFIELGNILNAKDRERILRPTNRQLLADWITEAFLK